MYSQLGSCGYSIFCDTVVVHALVIVGVASNIKINSQPHVFPVHQQDCYINFACMD